MITEETIRSGMPISNADMLLEINQAIIRILVAGQSYQIGSRKLTRADLSQLYKMRQELEAGVNADAAGATGVFDDCYVAVWPHER